MTRHHHHHHHHGLVDILQRRLPVLVFIIVISINITCIGNINTAVATPVPEPEPLPQNHGPFPILLVCNEFCKLGTRCDNGTCVAVDNGSPTTTTVNQQLQNLQNGKNDKHQDPATIATTTTSKSHKESAVVETSVTDDNGEATITTTSKDKHGKHVIESSGVGGNTVDTTTTDDILSNGHVPFSIQTGFGAGGSGLPPLTTAGDGDVSFTPTGTITGTSSLVMATSGVGGFNGTGIGVGSLSQSSSSSSGASGLGGGMSSPIATFETKVNLNSAVGGMGGYRNPKSINQSMTKEGAHHSARAIASSVLVVVLLLAGNYLNFWFGAVSPFAPKTIKCPNDEPIIRTIPFDKQTIPSEEAAWLEGRQVQVREAWKSYLERAGLEGFDIDAFVAKKKLPTVALAFSGGGSRALLVGAGVIRAMDDRIPEAVEKGTGGILQLSTYISGLSGGSFLIGSLFTTNFPTIDFLHDNVWRLNQDTFTPTGEGAVSDAGVYYEFLKDMAHKARAGYPTTITDYWARLVSVHTTNQTDYGVNVTMSGLGEFSNFKNHRTPFPVVVWNERLPGEKDISEYANVWESSIFESGSWSPTIAAFIKTKYLGTSLKNGVPLDRCTVGFDHFGYVVGISSSVFNQALQDLDKSTHNKILSPVIQFMTNKEVDAALVPNPFYQLDHVDSRTSTVKAVSLVDGGEDVSFYEGGWPNGSSIISTAEYAAASGVAFPPTPLTAEEFMETGLVDRTVFFGCHKAPKTAPHGQWPLLVYIPNRYYSYPSNASTFRRVYPASDSKPFLMNGFDLLATAGAQTPKPASQKEWSACVACGLVYRGLEKGEMVSEQCRKCLKDYCWVPESGVGGFDVQEGWFGEKHEVHRFQGKKGLHPTVVEANERRRKSSAGKV
ncbi:Lysophospholipase 1 [Blyttiomyces sp. JEL0837]|nr:Lysophospholipase 1 [Blyttiomyces sp. JEL0837]